MVKIDIVPYDRGMLPDIREIYAHYVLNSTATYHTTVPDLEAMGSLVEHGSERHSTWVLRRGEGEILGYGSIGPYSPREAYADTASLSIYLAPDCLGKGLGRRLLSHLEARARAGGFHALIAGISADNLASIRLFESAGFQKCAHYREVGKKFGKVLDVVHYEKLLDPEEA